MCGAVLFFPKGAAPLVFAVGERRAACGLVAFVVGDGHRGVARGDHSFGVASHEFRLRCEICFLVHSFCEVKGLTDGLFHYNLAA